MPIIANCIICGAEVQKRINAITCSPACSKENDRKRVREWKLAARKQPVAAECAICGAEFQKLGRVITCSKTCSAENKREWERAARKQPVTANCCICGTEFRKLGRTHACSKACSAERKRAWTRVYGKTYNAAYWLRPEVRERAASRSRAFVSVDGKPNFTANDVRAKLEYCPESGFLTWRPRPGVTGHERSWNTKYAGQRAGFLDRRTGYLHVNIFGRPYLAHRLAWLIATGDWPVRLDHRDGNGTNNQFSNLRLATASQNQANARRHSRNSTGFKGTSRTPSGRYRAAIGVNGKVLNLGHFDTAEEAHAAYLAAAEEHFGAFARAA
jgi:hypothetical protein